MSAAPLIVERDHALAIITLNNPSRANVLDLAMARAFHAAVAQVAGDPSVRALLITANGKQYVAVTTGLGGGSPRLVPRTLAPEINHPGTGHALYVFEVGSR